MAKIAQHLLPKSHVLEATLRKLKLSQIQLKHAGNEKILSYLPDFANTAVIQGLTAIFERPV